MYSELGGRFEEKLLSVVSDFVVSELLEEPDYSFISLNSLEVCLPSRHEFTLDHVSSNSYSILVRIQSKELNTWKMAYSSDALFSQVLKASITNNDEEGNYPQYQIRNGLIYFKDWNVNFRLCIPDSLWFSVMEEVHNTPTESAHGGHVITYNKVATTYYWPKMSRDIKRYVSTCDTVFVKRLNLGVMLLLDYCNLFLFLPNLSK
jgi:hypothetical protein